MEKKQKTNLEIMRHSAAHVMASAVVELFPETKLGIGPAIEDGFYYDFDMKHKITDEDLPKIEEKMKEIIKQDFPFESQAVSRKDAIDLMKKRGEHFKVELLEEIEDEKVSLYKHGDFIDLCRGPHLKSTGEVKAFKLISLAGAYWRGDEENPMLQRIYGTAFENKKELDEHLKKLEEAAKRDHRKLGKELDLFSIHHEEAGAGLIYYHPRGAMLKSLLEDFLKRENLRRGYELVSIPHIAKINLWRTSGHTEYYSENMYFTEIDKARYVVKPMNCPGHILIFNRKMRSYRDLPKRYFELGTVYRNERSGVLHGLLRVRGFTQDDAHIFCRPDQLEEEIVTVMDFVMELMKIFGFDYEINLSTKPESYVGSDENWELATKALEKALEKQKKEYILDPGAGTFYGPKIDIKLRDAIGRLWQGPTIQVDLNLPERFDLSYIGEDGKKHRPVMIHRAILGSLERFIGALIEHYAGVFPLWLSPLQAIILPIADRHLEYANELKEKLVFQGFRVEVDARREKIGHKIREAEMQKIPYMFIVGDKEVEEKNVSVRSRLQKDAGKQGLDEVINSLKKEVDEKK